MAAAYGAHAAPASSASILRTPRDAARGARDRARSPRSGSRFFGERLMGYRWNQPAYTLSYANRRRLEIARATATKPRMLLLDEPAAGMNPVETHEITELIAQLRDEGGYTILVIEHDMHVVEGISDRVVALDHGVKIAEGIVRRRSRPNRARRRGVPRRCARRRRSERERRRRRCSSSTSVDTYYGQIHILQGVDARGRRGRARLPARRQRVGQVDDAEDDPRHRPARAAARVELRRRGRDRAADELPDRAAGWRSCPRTGGCSRR